MPAVASFTGPTSPFQPGQNYDFTLVLDLAPGTPDEPITAEVRDSSGAVIATLAGTLDAKPDPETDPTGLVFRVFTNATGQSIGSITGYLGVRQGDTFTARWTWTAP